MDQEVYRTTMTEFIQALNDDEEEEAFRLLKTEGFVTRDSLFSWSSYVLDNRKEFDGVDLWKLAIAVMEHVGTDAATWNPPHRRRVYTPSDRWLGYTYYRFSRPTTHTPDTRTNAVLFHRLTPDCFTLGGLLSTRAGGHGLVGCLNKQWKAMACHIGIPKERPLSDQKYAQAVLDTILCDYPTLSARIANENFSTAKTEIRASLGVLCDENILYANSPDSIAASLFAADPVAFIPALRHRPTLLEGHRFSTSPRALLRIVKNDTWYSTTYGENYYHIMRAVDSESITKLIDATAEVTNETLIDEGVNLTRWMERVGQLPSFAVGRCSKGAF